MRPDRFDRFLPIAGVLAGLLFFVGLLLNRSDPSSETGPADTFSYWHDDRGRHQIVGLLVAPLVAFLLVFFGTALRRRLERDSAPATARSPSAEHCWRLRLSPSSGCWRGQ